MDAHRFDALTRASVASGSRRAVVVALAAVTGLLGNAGVAVGKKKGGRNQILCRPDGRPCKKQSDRCKRKFCLKTPFTIEARWSSSSQDHDAILFVPNEPGNTDPFPYIDYGCLASDTNNGTLYPFAFMSGDVQAGPGAEIATVRRLLAGKYEFWGRIHGPAASGDLTVRLRNANGKVIGAWDSPPNPSGSVLLDWHVFDINGVTHSVTVSGKVVNGLFDTVRPDTTYVCPA